MLGLTAIGVAVVLVVARGLGVHQRFLLTGRPQRPAWAHALRRATDSVRDVKLFAYGEAAVGLPVGSPLLDTTVGEGVLGLA